MPTTWNIGWNAAGVLQDFSTYTLAFADASVVNGDTLQLNYSNASKGTEWNEGGVTTSKGVTFTINPAITDPIYINSSPSAVSIELDAMTTTFNFLDMRVKHNGSSYIFIATTVNFSGTLNVARCNYQGGGNSRFVWTNKGTGTLNIEACHAIATTRSGIAFGYAGSGTMNILNCTAVDFIFGYTGSPGVTTVVKNCIAINCSSGGFSGTFHASSDYNYSTDASAPGANSINSDDPLTRGFLWSKADPYGGLTGFNWDFRLDPSSNLIGAGMNTGVTTDIDGNAISGSYPIGCSNGVVSSNVDPGVANVKNGVAYHIDDVDYTGTMVNTDPGVANVKVGTAYTIESSAKVGTLTSTDPGVANVKNGVAYTIESSAKLGTLTSTDPGVANVKNGISYTIESSAKVGTYSPDFPDAVNVLTNDTTNGVTGRWVQADQEDVVEGVQYGVDGTSRTGLAPTGFGVNFDFTGAPGKEEE